ncbi:MAG: hypothetical protein EXX96DRAFT_646245 [Benjaminiella poitrasii]|nr:MAG: hypothetical protein EXX96DRAFT_646245 [Benjaminiella poitrasii]
MLFVSRRFLLEIFYSTIIIFSSSLQFEMDFINYNSALEMEIYDEQNTDEMDIEEITLEYGNLQKIIDFETASNSNTVAHMECAVDALTTESVASLKLCKKKEQLCRKLQIEL